MQTHGFVIFRVAIEFILWEEESSSEHIYIANLFLYREIATENKFSFDAFSHYDKASALFGMDYSNFRINLYEKWYTI